MLKKKKSKLTQVVRESSAALFIVYGQEQQLKKRKKEEVSINVQFVIIDDDLIRSDPGTFCFESVPLTHICAC